jgi:hypothetical protein
MLLTKDNLGSAFNAQSCNGVGPTSTRCTACAPVAWKMERKVNEYVDRFAVIEERKKKEEFSEDLSRSSVNNRHMLDEVLLQKLADQARRIKIQDQEIARFKLKVALAVAADTTEEQGLDPADATPELIDKIGDLYGAPEIHKRLDDEIADARKNNPDQEDRYVLQQLKAELQRCHAAANSTAKYGLRHSKLLIKVCVGIASKVGGGFYSKISELFALPRLRSVQKAMAKTRNVPDGVLMSNVIEMMNQARGKNESDRVVVLAFDSMHLKSGMGFNGNSLVIEGFGDDFANPNLFVSEFKTLVKDSKVKDLPQLSKHYLAFFATSSDRSISNIVARYCLTAITGDWLAQEFFNIVAQLAFAGFMVKGAVADGASENRKFLRLVFDQLCKQYLSSCGKKLPVIRNWTWHPCDDKVKMYFMGDFSHIAKRVRNCMDASSPNSGQDRDMMLDGYPVRLSMLEAAWLCVDGKRGSSLNMSPLTMNHYNLDTFLKMRTFLAVQVLSQTQIGVVREYCRREEGTTPGITLQYSSLIKVCDKMDELIDICNGTDRSSRTGPKKGNPEVKSMKDDVIPAMLDILFFFSEWKAQAGKEKQHFVTDEVWTDLQTLILGTVSIVDDCSEMYGGDYVLHMRSLQQDVVENHFCN